MEHNATKSNHQPGDKYAVLVYDYQGQAGSNFRVYYDVQAGQHLYGGLVPCHE